MTRATSAFHGLGFKCSCTSEELHMTLPARCHVHSRVAPRGPALQPDKCATSEAYWGDSEQAARLAPATYRKQRQLQPTAAQSYCETKERGERKRERERERRETERARERVSKGGRQERREMVNQPSSADDCHSLRLLLRLEQGFVIVIEQHTPESLAYPNSVQAEDCTFGYKIEKWSLLAPCVAVLVLQAAVPL